MPNHSSSRRVQRSLPRLVLAIVLLVLAGVAPQEALEQAAGLKIVVIEGEDAVNIVQQRTAVAPVVEVRDRNDQPVAGAIVRFAIRNGRATFSGARSLIPAISSARRAAVSSPRRTHSLGA